MYIFLSCRITITHTIMAGIPIIAPAYINPVIEFSDIFTAVSGEIFATSIEIMSAVSISEPANAEPSTVVLFFFPALNFQRFTVFFIFLSFL